VDGLKRLYKEKIMPLEEKYKFVQFHGPLLTDGDFEAKPMVTPHCRAQCCLGDLLLGSFAVCR